MKRTTHSRVRRSLLTNKDIEKKVWRRISTVPPQQKWEPSLDELSLLISPNDLQKLILETDTRKQNRLLREVVRTYIKPEENSKNAKIFRWIVRDWGRISKGANATFFEWAVELEALEPNAIEKFIVKWERRRVSSWSKVLSFMDYKTYPIYDARNAAALNIIFEDIGIDRRFLVPGTQNSKVPPAFERMKDFMDETTKRNKHRWAHYREYKELMNSIVEKIDVAENALDVETRIFANSIPIIEAYIQKHGLG